MLKEELHERARRLVEAGLGYRSLAELVEDAVRRRVEELERLYAALTPAPKLGASPPGTGHEGALGQGGPTRGNEPQPVGVEAVGVRGDAG